MARSVQDVLAELRASAEPQRQAVLNQVANLPTEQAAAESGLEAKKTQAYDDILSGARRRGLGFSGIPLGEQAKYNATDYAPAVANMKSSFNQRKGTLESALAGIDSGLQSQAYDIYNQDRTFEEQQRQFNENMALQRQQAAASAKAASGFSLTGGAASGGGAGSAKIAQRADKGFTFSDANGAAISAAQYSQMMGIPFRQLLQKMASAGDAGAKSALGFVGDDYGYNPNAIGGNSGLYNSLVWGTGKQYTGGQTAPNLSINGALAGTSQVQRNNPLIAGLQWR